MTQVIAFFVNAVLFLLLPLFAKANRGGVRFYFYNHPRFDFVKSGVW